MILITPNMSLEMATPLSVTSTSDKVLDNDEFDRARIYVTNSGFMADLVIGTSMISPDKKCKFHY